MRSFADKNEAFLDKSRDSVVGREKEEADGENEETETICDSLEITFRMKE